MTAILSKEVWIKVPNWKRYNPRSDVEKTVWFRMENTMLESAQFNGFTPGEVITWIAIMSQCCQGRSDTVLFDLERLAVIRKVPVKEAWSAIRKLSSVRLKVIEVLPGDPELGVEVTPPEQPSNTDVTPPSRESDEDVTEAERARATTQRNETERNETAQNEAQESASPPEKSNIPDLTVVAPPPPTTTDLVNKGNAVDNSEISGDNSTNDVDILDPDADIQEGQWLLEKARVAAGLNRDGTGTPRQEKRTS